MQCLVLFCLFCLCSVAFGFYLPGVAPKIYRKGDRLAINVQSLISPENPLEFDYYSLPYCSREQNQHEYAENLGEALAGEKFATSPYEAEVLVPQHCKVVCRREFTKKQMDEFHDFAVLKYRANMRADNLPLAQVTQARDNDDESDVITLYELGFPVGRPYDPTLDENSAQYLLNNHLRFTIQYHPMEHYDKPVEDHNEVFIVGFTVKTASIKHSYDGHWNDTCKPFDCPLTSCFGSHFDNNVLPIQSNAETTEVIFTYDVEWELSPVKWASRWDVFLRMTNDDIHWFSVINSLVVLVFLTGIIAMIMARVLRKDFAMYNELAQDDETGSEIREETGWKLVYGDVFRAPKYPMALSALLGSGLQLSCMTTTTLVFAILGFLSPSNRGALLSTILLFFCLLGCCAGYVSARFGKLFKETNLTLNTALTGIAFPATIFLIFFIINLFLWANGSSSAVPFGTMVALIFLWFGMSLPLVFLGAFLGMRQQVISVPCRVNPIPRQIPIQPWYLNTLPTLFLSSILPFGVVFVEMTVIMGSLWQHKFYYLFGFLFLVFLILIVTVAEVSVVLIYLQLCSENYLWWWRSFQCGASVSVNLILYCIYYYTHHIHLNGLSGVASAVVFTGYSIIIALVVGSVCGFFSFVSCFTFIRLIYSSVKID